jgi:hypothetical protein
VRFLLARRHLEGVDELGLVLLLSADRVGLDDHVVQRPAEAGELVGAAWVQALSTGRPAATAVANLA